LPGRDLQLLKDAAIAAGEIAAKYFRADPEIWDKPGGQGPVTEADLEIDRMLRAELLAARPDYGWLSEETEDSPARLGHKRVFIVDPIDGTRAFIAGETTFSHSLAIVVAGQVSCGVVYLPMQEKLYAAAGGEAAVLNDVELTAGPPAEIGSANMLATKSQLDPALWPGGVPPFQRHFRPSIAARLCLAAEGRFDGMLTLRPAWEWDVAAGDLICREAGLRVTTRDMEPTRYNNPEPRLNGMIAAHPSLHAAIAAHLVPGPGEA